MTTVTAPPCHYCRHLNHDAAGLTCKAFPDGIPTPLIYSQADHRLPYAGDGGVRFEPDLTRGGVDWDHVFDNVDRLHPKGDTNG